jgi:leucyl aminopeptidase
VENAISGSAFRPGDVLRSRSGISVSIGNTDAEGRLVLADALALAGEEDPQLIIDMATLTGAARAALGPDVPPFYTENETLAGDIAHASRKVYDPVWRMPLWWPYEDMLKSKVADIDNAGSAGMAGSITAALFLARFIRCPSRWVHFDIYGWTAKSRPGRPEGGEAQAIRALFEVLSARYAS